MVGYKHDIFDYEVNVNYFWTLKENSTIKLAKIEKKPGIIIDNNLYAERLYASTYIKRINKTEIIYSLQSQIESIIYFARNNRDIKFYYLEHIYLFIKYLQIFSRVHIYSWDQKILSKI